MLSVIWKLFLAAQALGLGGRGTLHMGRDNDKKHGLTNM